MYRAIIATFLGVALVTGLPLGPGFTPGTIAYASGGGRGPDEGPGVKKRAEKPAKKKPAKKKAAKKKAAPAKYVPDIKDVRAKRSGPARDMQNKLEDYAIEDNLKGLATSRKRMKAFKKAHDALLARARTTREKIDANNVYTQLQRYRGARKKNKALAYYADGILAGLAAMNAYDRLQAAQDKFDLAQKFGSEVQKIDAKITRDDARAEYKEKRNKVPKGLRPLHPKP